MTHTYHTDAFFERYRDYLLESSVRESHDRAIRTWHLGTGTIVHSVVDIGCGLGEFPRYAMFGCPNYLGVDIHRRLPPHLPFIMANYIRGDWLHRVEFDPTTFVSLFSIEMRLPAARRYELYDKIFSSWPSLQFGLSAGFYYADRVDVESVDDVCGVASYQTMDHLQPRGSRVYGECRLTMPVPSKTFGQNVVEVWKFFERADT